VVVCIIYYFEVKSSTSVQLQQQQLTLITVSATCVRVSPLFQRIAHLKPKLVDDTGILQDDSVDMPVSKEEHDARHTACTEKIYEMKLYVLLNAVTRLEKISTLFISLSINQQQSSYTHHITYRCCL